MTTSQFSKVFPFVPTPATVSSKVAEHIDTLMAYGFDKGKILDIYVESQMLSNGFNNITNPMRYMSSYLGTAKGDPDIRFRELERIYNNVVRAWSNFEPKDFLQQFDAYMKQGVNDTGLENGMIREHFLSFSFRDEKLLVIDPHPEVMDAFRKENRDITFTFSDERHYRAYESKKAGFQLVRLCSLPMAQYNRVLYYAGTHSPEKIRDTLQTIHDSLVQKQQTNIHIVMQTQFLEKRKSKPELWNYLVRHYSIFKICLIDKKAVNLQPKKRCLMILQNASGCSNEILVQKTKLLDNGIFATLEFRKIPFSSFVNRDRTLSEMYNTDYTDYSEPNRRAKPFEYRFSKEISIWVSCTKGKNGKYRPYYSVYDYPTVEQLRKNTLPRGKAIKTRIPGKWYNSEEEAIASAEELLLKDISLANVMRKVIGKQFVDKPVSAKTHLFLHWEELKKTKGFDDKFCESIFFVPNSAIHPICAWMVDGVAAEMIKQVMDEYTKQLSYSNTMADKFWEHMQMILEYAVIDRRCVRNPIRSLIRQKYETYKTKSNMRKALVNRSFSKETERALIAYLLSDTENPVLARMLLMKYFTRLPNSVLCALTWGDYLYDSELDLGQLSVTKRFPFRSQKAEPIMPEERRRFIPVVSLLSKMMQERIADGQCKSHEQPLFSLPKSRYKPITPRQLQDYCNMILQKLNLPEFKIMIFDDQKPPESDDLNDYGGDVLLTNFEFHSHYDALLEPEEIDFIAGRKPRTTEAQYYCDYNNVFLQLVMRVKLDRWVATLVSQKVGREVHCVQANCCAPLEITPLPTGNLNELYIELDIEEEIIDEEMLLSVAARFGGSVCVEFLEEVQ